MLHVKLFVYPLTPIEIDCRDRTSNTVLAFTYLIFLQILVTHKCMIYFFTFRNICLTLEMILIKLNFNFIFHFHHVYLIYFYSFKNTLKVMPDFCFFFFFFFFFFLIRQKHTDKHALKTNVFYKYLSIYSIVRGKFCNFA